ncbi:MAG: hypothetical protein N2C14_08360, partial [Planctomycetales bacterium]
GRHLKLYNGPETMESEAKVADDSDRVTIHLGQIIPMLIEAVHDDRTWLQDFEGDEVTVSNDLYDVIMAYQHFRPSA